MPTDDEKIVDDMIKDREGFRNLGEVYDYGGCEVASPKNRKKEKHYPSIHLTDKQIGDLGLKAGTDVNMQFKATLRSVTKNDKIGKEPKIEYSIELKEGKVTK